MSKINKKIQNLFINLYRDLELSKKNNFDDDIKTKFRHIKYKKVLTVNGHNGTFKLPITSDIISMIYNESNRNIKFNIVLNGLPLCELNIKPNEYIYPLYNNSIFPLLLFSTGYYLCINMENNNDINDLLIICTNFNNKQKQIIKLNNNYYLENNHYMRYDTI